MKEKSATSFIELHKHRNNEKPSKTKIKQKMLHLQKLGESLIDLPQAKIDSLHLEETLIEAIDVAKKITSREGNRRHMQFIGKIMRNLDEEIIHKINALIESKP